MRRGWMDEYLIAMSIDIKRPIKIVFVALLMACLRVAAATTSDSATQDANESVPRLAAVRYITWWSHDATGYHPAICLRLENISGQNIIGERLRLQARFTNVRTTDVTVARWDERISLAKNQQRDLTLKGPIPFELSIDENAWPTIECKAMSRLGDVGDSGTQTLAITNLERITMTDDEAESVLEKQPDLRRVVYSGAPPHAQENNNPRHAPIDQPIKPLIATAAGLNSPNSKIPREIKQANSKFIPPPSLPSLGDNFYIFEKHFGLPVEIEAPNTKGENGKAGLTWASYKPVSTFSQAFVASRNGATADAIILTFPGALNLKEEQISIMAKQLSAEGKSGKLSAFSHSVRYLASGRTEIAEASSPTCRAMIFRVSPSKEEPSKMALLVSRVGGDPEDFLLFNAQKVKMLQLLLSP